MLVVSDTSPISNLLLVNRIDLLVELYGNVIVPPAVWQEILALETFGLDLSDFKRNTWIQVVAPVNMVLLEELLEVVDAGEAQAITLAKELPAELLLIDERKGWTLAQSLHVKPIGLLGILVEAKAVGLLVAIKPILDELIEIAGFWVGETLYRKVLTSVGE